MANVKDSILNSTKKILGIDENYDAFDLDIMTHINSVFFTLYQLGVGPSQGFRIDGPDEVWDTFLGTESPIDVVRSYIYLRVRLLFDPPATSFAITAMKEQAQEMEWRMLVAQESVVINRPPTIIDRTTNPMVDGGGVV